MKTQFKYFQGSYNDLSEVRKQYYELAKVFHPDRGGNTAAMQQINNEYAELCEAVLRSGKYENWSNDFKENEVNISIEIQAIINDLMSINLMGCSLELCGSWLWLTGIRIKTDDELRNSIKSIGFTFRKNKCAWSWNSGEYRKKSKKRFELDDIRNLYGSHQIEIKQFSYIS